MEGHCDERGTAEYNLALGDQRARAARDYLVSPGRGRGPPNTVSYGKERPLDPLNSAFRATGARTSWSAR